jgi:hypothetical protein
MVEQTTPDDTPKRIEKISVEPVPSGDAAAVELGDAVRVVADHADLDGSDNLTLYRERTSVAHAKVLGVPLEVPNLVRRAVEYGETGVWE